MSQGAKPVYLVQITPVAGTTLSAVTGDRPLDLGSGSYPNSVADVRAVTQEIDPISRVSTVGRISIVWKADGFMRRIASIYRLKGKAVTIKLGAQSLTSIFDWAPVALVVIAEVLPAEDSIVMTCADASVFTRDATAFGNYMHKHPLTAASGLLVAAGQPSALYNLSSLDYTTYPTQSHWNTLRSQRATFSEYPLQNAIVEPESVTEMVQHLIGLTGGSVLVDETGPLTFTPYSSGATSVRAFTTDDIDDLEQVSTFENLFNRIEFYFAKLKGGDFAEQWTIEDDDSQSNYAYPGEATTTYAKHIESPWLRGVAKLWGDLPSAATVAAQGWGSATTMDVKGAIQAGFCGTRVTPNLSYSAYATGALSDYQASADQLNGTTRVAYFRLRGIDRAGVERTEVVKATAFSAALSPVVGGGSFTVNNTPSPDADGNYRPAHGRFTVVRAQLGTSEVDWFVTGGAAPVDPSVPPAPIAKFGDISVSDITIPVAVCQRILNRCANGVPILRVRVPTRHHDIQIADFVTIDHGVVLKYGLDGSPSTTKWEVVGKEVRALDDSPGVVLRLAWVSDASTYTPSFAYRGDDLPLWAVYTEMVFLVVNDDAGNVVRDRFGDLIMR
ncbi:MAG: hypothetical protein RL139_1567 [Gemmatimonadota bacterium]|jgi:hypothetical protein